MSTRDPTLTNAAVRLPKHDAYMFMAMWLEHAPWAKPVIPHLTGSGAPPLSSSMAAALHGTTPLSSSNPNPNPINASGSTESASASGSRTGALLVDAHGRIAAFECSGHAHAVARAVLRTSGAAAADLNGADVYVSRFPSPLCTKLMVQTGVRRCFYFPASLHDASTEAGQANREQEYNAVHRMVQNSAIALSVYVPEWIGQVDPDCPTLIPPSPSPSSEDNQQPSVLWAVDPFYLDRHGGEWARVRTSAVARFHTLTEPAFRAVVTRYSAPLVSRGMHTPPDLTPKAQAEARHAMVLAHIASRRTDDPKVGVGAALVYPDHADPATYPAENLGGRYVSVGWNGFPKKSQRNDYSRVGADEALDARDELKYAYVLHAEQNTLLFRTPWPGGYPLVHPLGARMYSTKYPCDECAPLIADAGVHRMFSLPPSSWVSMQPPPSSAADGAQPLLAPPLTPPSSMPLSSSSSGGFLAATPSRNGQASEPRASAPSPTPQAHRGLTYTRLRQLVPFIWLFDIAGGGGTSSVNSRAESMAAMAMVKSMDEDADEDGVLDDVQLPPQVLHVGVKGKGVRRPFDDVDEDGPEVDEEGHRLGDGTGGRPVKRARAVASAPPGKSKEATSPRA